MRPAASGIVSAAWLRFRFFAGFLLAFSRTGYNRQGCALRADSRRHRDFPSCDMKKKSADRFTIAAWFLHWGTAGFILLAFAMPFAQFFSQYLRRPIHFWHELHITVGTIALILAIVRLALIWMRSRAVPARLSGSRSAAILQPILLGMIAIIAFFGLLAFGQPVLGAKMKFLGLWTFPEIRSLISAPSGQFRLLHWYFSYAFLGALAVHIWIGVRRDPKRKKRLIWKKIRPW